MPRLFIAIDLPGSTKEALVSLAEPQDGVRWTKIQQLHLTLRFLGDTPRGRIAPLLRALKTVTQAPPALRARGVGAFPNARRARVLWAGIDADERLFTLHEKIERAVQEAGLPGDRQRYHPHLTIARIKRPDRAWVAGFLDEHQSFKTEAFEANAFTLYGSTLTWKGAVHSVFERFTLEAPPSAPLSP